MQGAHPVTTTAPVPWMSSLKHRHLSLNFSRIANALSVWKSSNCMRAPARAHMQIGICCYCCLNVDRVEGGIVPSNTMTTECMPTQRT